MKYIVLVIALALLTACAQQLPAPAPAPICPKPPPSHWACDAAAFVREDAAQQTDRVIRWAEQWTASKIGEHCKLQTEGTQP